MLLPLLLLPPAMSSIRCARCQTDITKEVKFCPECGHENSSDPSKLRATTNPDIQVISEAGGLEALLDKAAERNRELARDETDR